MTGHRKFSELTDKLDANPDYRAVAERVAAKLAAEDAAHEHSLKELRRAREQTQVQLAQTLGKSQTAISDLEHRTDMYMSTMREFVEAMGGQLHLFAEFDHEIIPIKTFSEINSPDQTESGAA